MTMPFPKTDLPKLMALPGTVRALALLASLRFVAEIDLARAAVRPGEIEELGDEGLAFRLTLPRTALGRPAEPVLALTKAGAARLADLWDFEPESIPFETRSSCSRSAMFMDHGTATARFAILLARELGPDTTTPLLSWEDDPERLADSVHILSGTDALGRTPLVGDGLAVVRGPRGPEGLLVEIDRGTERPGYIANKLRAYVEWWRLEGPRRRFDLPATRILWVAPDARRAGKLRDIAREATGGKASGLFWFAAEPDLLAEGITAPVWRTTKDEGLALWS